MSIFFNKTLKCDTKVELGHFQSEFVISHVMIPNLLLLESLERVFTLKLSSYNKSAF